MVVGHCASCDLTFTDSIVRDNFDHMKENYPIVICPRCGTVVWTGAQKQIAFAKSCHDRESGRTEVEDPVK